MRRKNCEARSRLARMLATHPSDNPLRAHLTIRSTRSVNRVSHARRSPSVTAITEGVFKRRKTRMNYQGSGRCLAVHCGPSMLRSEYLRDRDQCQ